MLIKNDMLNSICLNAVNSITNGDCELKAIAVLLFKTGLRISEVLTIKNWLIYNQDAYKVKLLKSDSIRLIQKKSVPEYLQRIYDHNTNLFFHNYRSVDYSLHKVFPCIKSNQSENFRRSHLFRYNFIRQLYDNGKTVKEIQKEICHKNLEITKKYLFSYLTRAN